MITKIDKDKLKNELTIEQIESLVAELGGEPKISADGLSLTARTICHGGHSRKLYYYSNSHLFHCYTECSPETFDIYELVLKVNKRQNKEWNLAYAIDYVASYFGYVEEAFNNPEIHTQLVDWKILERYNKNNKENYNKQKVEMKIFDDKILKYLPTPRILPWEQEGISQENMKIHHICYDPVAQGIVIPHYDINNNLIGIRERTLIKEEEQYGKYKPAIINGIMYNHPLSFALYNLNNSKDNIRRIQKAIVFESEKSTMMFGSYFGMENDISVATCGSSLISYQVDLLLSLGVKEIIVAFDRQYQKLNDDEHKKWCRKLSDIHKKYSSKVQISFMFDKKELLGYKMSPIDAGPDIFMKLFKERITL